MCLSCQHPQVYNPCMTSKALRAFTLILLLVSLAGNAFAATHIMAHKGANPDVALKLLMAGNRRFVSGKMEHPHQSAQRRQQTAKEGQRPFAVILSCSDSRVPPEVIFDAGIGDIFSVRVAGNVADKAAVGSIEYAIDHLGATLIMVLGHSGCGAVSAAVSNAEVGPNIASITDRIKPAVAKARAGHFTGDALLGEAIKDNVGQGIQDILSASPDLSKRVKAGEVEIVGGVYDLDTGRVTKL